MSTDPKFQAWMNKVDLVLLDMSGVGLNDLADWGYWDAFNNGMSAEEAAREVLAEAGWEEER